MKQIRFIAVIALVAALSAACTKEMDVSEGKSVSQITATWAECQTKTVLGEDGTSILWSPNDEISVFYNEDGVKFTSINSKPKSTAIFTCNQAIVYGSTEESERSMLYAIYPYSGDNAQRGDTLSLTVPCVQTAEAGSFARGSFPSVGRSKDTNISFYNVCGGIRFTVGQSGISQVDICAPDAVLAGNVDVTFDDENHPNVLSSSCPYNFLELYAPTAEGFEMGKWYYISSLPVKIDTSFIIRLHKTSGEVGEKHFSSSHVIKRSTFGSIAEIDKDVAFKKAITGISLNKTNLILAPLTAAELNYTITPSDAEYKWLKWESTNESVAIVNNGIVTAIAKGECEIILTTDNGCAALCHVQVGGDESVIIKEVYIGGCSGYYGDQYIILYNNSPVDADASDIVITFAAPYNGNANNRYYQGGSTLLYEYENWIPAYGAIWWFKNSVTIPAYSQIVIACYGAINHTENSAASVDLSKADYYWMSNESVPQYSNPKYTCSDNIPATHHMTCSPFTQGNAWALSVASPALYIGKMKAAEAEVLSKDSENYDHTLGTFESSNVVKFPKANVLDAIEVWNGSYIETSHARFSSDINIGYVAQTAIKQGYTLYRNVDITATQNLSENAGKLVTGYAFDPCGIDAEKSIQNGAHIIYMDTNNSANDFHQREVASIK